MIEEEIRRMEEEIKNCKRCELWKTRKNPVVGEGSLTTKIMFVGEAPGEWEDKEGRPFVGKAGRVLDELLDFLELKRKNIYITNVLKCRPPKNRNPLSKEIKACSCYLDKQIELIKPDVIVTLGNFALSYIFEKFLLLPQKISKVHGKVFKVHTPMGVKRIIPLYHPAVATYRRDMKKLLLKDFKAIINLNRAILG